MPDKAQARRSRRAAAARDEIAKRYGITMPAGASPLKRPVGDERRFIENVPPTGSSRSPKAGAEAAGTLFPNTLHEPGIRPLTSGVTNSKLGGRVLVGRLRGARIYHLSLEERATCPITCKHWRTCYGNGMPLAKRFRHGPDLVEALEGQIEEIMALHPALVRLHTLGDFYSVDYVKFWHLMVAMHDDLSVFGYTAWPHDTPIGEAISEARDEFGLRFAIRHSDAGGRWGTRVIPRVTTDKRDGAGIVCPEQRESVQFPSTRHCGNCAVCWSTDDEIVFMAH